MNLNNKMLNIDKKKKKTKKTDKKPFFIEIKKQKIKNVFYTTLTTMHPQCSLTE